jgi:hypothetical protein
MNRSPAFGSQIVSKDPNDNRTGILVGLNFDGFFIKYSPCVSNELAVQNDKDLLLEPALVLQQSVKMSLERTLQISWEHLWLCWVLHAMRGSLK